MTVCKQFCPAFSDDFPANFPLTPSPFAVGNPIFPRRILKPERGEERSSSTYFPHAAPRGKYSREFVVNFIGDAANYTGRICDQSENVRSRCLLQKYARLMKNDRFRPMYDHLCRIILTRAWWIIRFHDFCVSFIHVMNWISQQW